MATYNFTVGDPQEWDVTFTIAGQTVAMMATISELEAEADTWDEPGNTEDFSVTWSRANVAFAPVGTDEPIWQMEIYADDLDVVKSLTDSQISDACDEMATQGFLAKWRDGELA